MDISFDTDTEIEKLNAFLNGKKIPLFKYYTCAYHFTKGNIKIKYLLYVLELTHKYPEVEIYLKELLKNFSIEELNNVDTDIILHYMIVQSQRISLNSFEIILNFGINVNGQDKYGRTSLHFLRSRSASYVPNIIDLLVKYGADLNIVDHTNRTVLDELTPFNNLNKYLKTVIMTLIDLGAKINNPYKDTRALEFIKSYCSNSIKPAIKK